LTQSSLYEFFLDNNPNLLLTLDDKEAESAYDVASFLDIEAYVLPDFRAFYGEDLRSYKDELYLINTTLFKYYNSKSPKKILISPFKTARHRLPKKEYLEPITIEFAKSYSLEKLKESLVLSGYGVRDVVETQGEVSFRGDVVDIYPITSENPYRISFFGDECESIREFDVSSQMSSKEELESVFVVPAFLALKEDELELFESKVSSMQSDALVKDIDSLGFWAIEGFGDALYKKEKTYITKDAFKELLSEEEALESHIEISKLPQVDDAKKYKDIVLSDDLSSLLELHKNKKQTIICNNEAILKQYGLEEYKDLVVKKRNFLNIISNDELIISLNKKVKKSKKKRVALSLDELKVGQYVVHDNYGIGIFKGIVKRDVAGAKRDFVEVAYQGEDRLLVPVDSLDLLSRYVADGGLVPAVDKLGKGSFTKLKQKVKDKLFAIASEIVALSAKRELIEGVKISCDFPEMELFRNRSGFEYTEDQKRAIEEICEDLSSGKVMDRVLSGDVGFGKTEVAMNAVYATIKAGFQVAFAAPTKILATQHFATFKKRFEDEGIRIAKLDNSLKPKERQAILDALKEGSLDLVVGTHGVLNTEFKNLALFIVDEEHKFGVKQKEKIKSLKEAVHILSMSATPIPRTLNQALSSIKGMSSITTPPKERVGVRTFVKEHSEKLLKEAILREKRRGGQIFYIYNNIATIGNKKEELQSIVPELSAKILHSKVPPKESEEIMDSFGENEFFMLLSTSIIESGIHLPNVNTIIVENADKFGIADLHQLRGRVGRGSKEGYCYLLVEDKETLTPESKKRLLALESNSFLGSGYNLAYYDLEIRGGGNILGEAQSGHIKQIGYALYLKMLEDAIKILSGKGVEEKSECEINLNVSAFISEELVSEDRLRLDLYRRLSKADSLHSVYKIEEEIIDRFGELDESTKRFLELISIKVLTKEKKYSKISNYNENITFEKDGKKELIKSPSRDDDDVLKTVIRKLREGTK
jgi:transcription-repair coupling factor (superfamily II helicase)